MDFSVLKSLAHQHYERKGLHTTSGLRSIPLRSNLRIPRMLEWKNVHALSRAALSEKARSGQLTTILSAGRPAISQDKAMCPASAPQAGGGASVANTSNNDETHYEKIRMALRTNLVAKACTTELRVSLGRSVGVDDVK